MQRYDAILDIIALTSDYPSPATGLAVATQRAAVEYVLQNKEPGELLLLLRIAFDLGYVDELLYCAHSKALASAK